MEQFTNRLTSVVSISRTGSSSSRTPFSDVGRSHPHPKTESYQIRSYNPLFVFGRRDVPPERLYKDMQLAEKGVSNPDFVSTGDRILIPKPNQQAIAFGILDVVSTLMKQNSAAYRWL
jgi:hypothetical protein